MGVSARRLQMAQQFCKISCSGFKRQGKEGLHSFDAKDGSCGRRRQQPGVESKSGSSPLSPDQIEKAMTMLAQETLQAVCPIETPAPRQPWVTDLSWGELRVHSLAWQAHWRSTDEQEEAVKKAVVGGAA